ncbi:MAG: MFS transporter [Acidobacteriaceae bacterium]
MSASSMAIAVICIALFGNAIWVANLFTLPADLFEANEVGTVAGFSGTGGGIGGAIASLVTGYLVVQFSFKPIFLLAGLMNLTAAALIFWLLPDRYFQKDRVG